MAQEDKIVDYLSKEIETQTNGLMKFRERVNYAILINPIVALVSLVSFGKGIPKIRWGELTGAARVGLAFNLLIVVLSYLTLAIAYSFIERHMWEQCNKWRKWIAEISQGNMRGFTFKDLEFTASLQRGYLLVYLAFILAFVSALTIALILRVYV